MSIHLVGSLLGGRINWEGSVSLRAGGDTIFWAGKETWVYRVEMEV